MAERGKRPGEHPPEGRHSGPALLGALSPLPEVLLAHLSSFLSGRDLARLGGACAALHESPVTVWPRLRVCLRTEVMEPEALDEEGRQRCAKAMGMLAKRAANGLRELRLTEGEVPEPFWSAMRAEGRPLHRLNSLYMTFKAPLSSAVSGRGMQQAVAQVLTAGRLPMLRELFLITQRVESVWPLWRALGEGACPRLEMIQIQWCSWRQLLEVVEALRARPEGCEALRVLRLSFFGEDREQAVCEALQALLSRLSPRSLEELALASLSPESLQVAIIPALASSSWAALKTLYLNLRSANVPMADGLVDALARGAMPNLTSLHLSHGSCSDEAWMALGEAMGPEGTCLRRLKTFRLHDVISEPPQLAILCRAIGAGHGCPELELMSIDGGYVGRACGAALAPAFRPPHGLPRLKQLLLSRMNLRDLDELAEALHHRPHASQPVEVIKLWGCTFRSVAALGGAMVEGASLAGLRDLVICAIMEEEEADEWLMQMVEALAGGAGKQLQKIDWAACRLSVYAVNGLLQCLAVRGACPRLRSLKLFVPGEPGLPEGDRLHACSIDTILGGRAACSATLRELDLNVESLSNEGVRRLAACLREPQAIQLETFNLNAGERGACGAVTELLRALAHRAGDRLQSLSVHLSGSEEAELTGVEDQVIAIIKAGGLPAVQPGPSNLRICHVKLRGKGESAVVQRALKERAQAQWLASWQGKDGGHGRDRQGEEGGAKIHQQVGELQGIR